MKTDRYADENARPFDPQWETARPSLVEYLGQLANTLEDWELKSAKRQRKRSIAVHTEFVDAVQAITFDLFRAHLSDTQLQVGIGMGRTALQAKAKGRYDAAFLSARTFEDTMKALQAADLIELTRPHWDDPSGRESRVARYQATAALVDALQQAGASVVTIRRRKDAEGIIFKGKKNKKTGHKPLVSYGEVVFANDARHRLAVINGMLLDHWADVALTRKQIEARLIEIARERKKTPAHPLDYAARTVHRVFNNRDWEQGGRFYGAWWMGCPSALRPHIVINGKRTVEVDYSGLHAAMLFAQAGLKIPDDPYERCLTGKGGKAERKLVKLTFNALLNADGVRALSEIDDYNADLTGRKWEDFKRFIVQSYPEFTQHFGTGVGLFLQRKDSDMAEAVMLEFARKGDACLPVHDSFIVHHALKDELIDTMKGTFQSMFGTVGEVDFDLGVQEPVEATGMPVKMDATALLDLTDYESRHQEFLSMR